MEPTVSVIIPVYNGSAHLGQCLDSVLAQTMSDMEILCVDDGSTDETPAILAEYAGKDSRIRVITQENAGAAAARNHGLREARGKYLSFLDADDFFEPALYEKAVAKLRADRADFVVVRSDQYLEDKKCFRKTTYTLKTNTLPPYTPFSYREITDNVFLSFVGWAWDKVYDRAFIVKHGLTFQEQRTSNDLLFVFSALICAERITYLDQVLAHQRRNDSTSLSNTREKSWDCFYHALTALRAFLQEKGCYEELSEDFINYALHFSLWNLNTITGECKEKLYRALREEYFPALLVTPERHYWNQDEERQFREILERSPEEYPVKLTVVIPVYNAEKYIRSCLDSVLKDQEIGLEVICVDDASTDGTGEILREYAASCPNVRIIRNETNLYAGRSRNKGLEAAKGRYIHFLDADDYTVPHAYRPLYEICDKYHLDWLKAGGQGIDENTGAPAANHRYSMEWLNSDLQETLLDFKRFPGKFLEYMSLVPWNGLYRRDFLLDNGIRFNDLFCVNDRSFFVETCVKGSRMMFTRQKLCMHRMNVSNSLVNKRAQHFDCQFESYRLMKKICDENQVSEKVRFEILEHELYDLTNWYVNFCTPLLGRRVVKPAESSLMFSLQRSLEAFLEAEVDEAWFRSFGNRSRYLLNLGRMKKEPEDISFLGRSVRFATRPVRKSRLYKKLRVKSPYRRLNALLRSSTQRW